MNNDVIFKFLKEKFSSSDHSCMIFVGKDLLFSSDKRGVSPLIDFIDSFDSPGNYLLADKVIGKAAALLCLKAGIKAIYTNLISTQAKKLLNEHGLPVRFENEVPAVQNRSLTGLCPMESLSKGVETPEEMYSKVVDWLQLK